MKHSGNHERLFKYESTKLIAPTQERISIDVLIYLRDHGEAWRSTLFDEVMDRPGYVWWRCRRDYRDLDAAIRSLLERGLVMPAPSDAYVSISYARERVFQLCPGVNAADLIPLTDRVPFNEKKWRGAAPMEYARAVAAALRCGGFE